MNRKEAIEHGELTYQTTKPCPKCGEFTRYVSSYSCYACSIKRGLEKLSNSELMRPYRTKRKNSHRLKKWRKNNPIKVKEQKQRAVSWYDKHPDRYFKAYILKRYGLTVDEYDNIIKQQSNLCAICYTDFQFLSKKKIHIDHDHKTNKVRGILCHNCNAGLGLFKDNPLFLQKAIQYLKE